MSLKEAQTPAQSENPMGPETTFRKESEMDTMATPAASDEATSPDTSSGQEGIMTEKEAPTTSFDVRVRGRDITPFLLEGDWTRPDGMTERPSFWGPEEILYKEGKVEQTVRLTVAEIELLCEIWANVVLEVWTGISRESIEPYGTVLEVSALERLAYFDEILGHDRVKDICTYVYWDYDFDRLRKAWEDQCEEGARAESERRGAQADRKLAELLKTIVDVGPPPPEPPWNPGDPPPPPMEEDEHLV